MPDIRSFFGGKGGVAQLSSQEKPAAKKGDGPTKAKGRGKRKVISDDEEDDAPPAKKPTPRKSTLKRKAKEPSPAGEATTTSEYFASKGKSKPAKPESPVKKESLPTMSTPRSKPLPQPVSNGRTSGRRKAKTNYAEANESEDEKLATKAEDDSGEDIFMADYKGKGRRGGDGYQEATSDEELVVKPTVKSTRNKAAKPKCTTPPSSRKRKSTVPEDDDEDELLVEEPKKAKRTKTAPAKSPAAKKTKEAPTESKETQSIFDQIPLVKAPSPPRTEEPKKFDFTANAARQQAGPAGGAKEPPMGQENCLAGLSFVFTGVLDGLGREEGAQLVKRYGGKVMTSPSSKTNYVVLGDEAGPKKLETIQKYGLKTINEDGLFELIRLLPANGGSGVAAEKFEEKKREEARKAEEAVVEMEKAEKKKAIAASGASVKSQQPSKSMDAELWTVKYAPQNLTQICGNKGNVEKLQRWLRAFPSNLRAKFKKGGADATGNFRAVMLHGPPGIGKTTAAHLAAKLEGYDVVESNASDTRSKKLVDQGLKGVLDTTSLLGYFAGDGKKVEGEKKKLVLIMDEVDGMSAGDRGGVGALAATIKKTHIPMILICNDRRLPKMKPFDHVVYDLSFNRPTVDQIRGRIMTILFREGMREQIPTTVINSLIEGSRSDIRQIINMISTARLDKQAMDFDEGKKMSRSWEKHIILKPWDIISKILSSQMWSSASSKTLNDKTELYFNDHEISPLMLAENYLGTTPLKAQGNNKRERDLSTLVLAEKAAASISDGDLVDRMIHGSQQQWSLMPAHAIMSFVRPASFVAGSLAGYGQTRFPSWLGNNSKSGKNVRLIKEIQGHMRLRTSADRHEIRQQYFSLIYALIVERLQAEGQGAIDAIIDLMDSYFLTKEDWDAATELGVGTMNGETLKIDTQTRSAFTRIYNQRNHPMPFMKASNVNAPKKLAKDKPDLEEAIEESDEGEEVAVNEDEGGGNADDEALDLRKDKYVKAPKKKPASKKATGKKGLATATAVNGDEEEGSEEERRPLKGKGKAKDIGAEKKGRGKK
ncbi:hypothetical protein MMC25_006973 [Agyrium rufum]|nr:hypothetical protein [Agyrium rufum]